MTHQLKSSEIKKEVIATAADVVTKLKMGDKKFADDLVVEVDHNQLNVTTKVITFFTFDKFQIFVHLHWGVVEVGQVEVGQD